MGAVERLSQMGLHSWDALGVCAMQRKIDRDKEMRAGPKVYGGKRGVVQVYVLNSKQLIYLGGTNSDFNIGCELIIEVSSRVEEVEVIHSYAEPSDGNNTHQFISINVVSGRLSLDTDGGGSHSTLEKLSDRMHHLCYPRYLIVEPN